MDHPKVSVIIPHWNGVEILAECLESLVQTEYENLEIIVVDNASTDGSPDWVSRTFPHVILIKNDYNYRTHRMILLQFNAIKDECPIDIASAPRAIALATSAPFLMPPA